MPLNVCYYPPGRDYTIDDTYPNSYVVKVLQSGVLQIRQPLEVDVPEFVDDPELGERMVTTKELVVAIYSGKYRVWRTFV